MKALLLGLGAMVAGVASASAQSTSTSASASLLHAPAGDLAGGGRITNAGGTIVADISVGDPVSGVVSLAGGGALAAKGNLVGQLVDVRSAQLTASPATIPEGGTRQLTGLAILDDATTLNLAGLGVWGNSLPLTNLNPLTGVATAGLVFQDTPTSASVTYRGIRAELALTVLNVNPDNFGAYAGDGLDDDWQALYFGLPPNANATPAADPDGDGQDNRLEFLAGFVPIDARSMLQFTIVGFSAPGVVDFRLNKAVPGRTYTLTESATLAPPYTAVRTFSVATEETNKLVQDPAAPAGRNFYRLDIARP